MSGFTMSFSPNDTGIDIDMTNGVTQGYVDGKDAETLQSAETYADGKVDTEKSARLTAEGLLRTATAKVASDLVTEQTTRSNADTALQTNIGTETTARQTADTAINTAISDEVTARQTADTGLSDNITTIQNDIGVLRTDIAADFSLEAENRTNADTTLQTNINTEATTREQADTALQTSVSTNTADIATINSHLQEKYELIEKIVPTETVDTIVRSQEPDGTAYSLRNFAIKSEILANTTQTGCVDVYFNDNQYITMLIYPFSHVSVMTLSFAKLYQDNGFWKMSIPEARTTSSYGNPLAVQYTNLFNNLFAYDTALHPIIKKIVIRDSIPSNSTIEIWGVRARR